MVPLHSEHMFKQLNPKLPIRACDLQYIWITSSNSPVTIKPFEHATNWIFKSYIYLYHKFEHLHEPSHSNMPQIQSSNLIWIWITSLNKAIQTCHKFNLQILYIFVSQVQTPSWSKPFTHATNSIFKSYIYLYHKFEHLHDQSHSHMPPIQFPTQFNFQTIYPKFEHFNNHMLSPDTLFNGPIWTCP